MSEAFDEAMGILKSKQWADLDFDGFWQRVKDKLPDKRLFSAHPAIEGRARKFYEEATPLCFGEEFDSPELTVRALRQVIRFELVYGFICGYVARIKDAGE